MDGEEVLDLLRGDARTRGIPVIVMSADATASRIRRLTEAGAWAYVTKPLDVRDTLSLIDRALAGAAP
jgi:CheY-like chemotaxis protein